MKFKTFRAIVIGVGLAGLAGGIALCLSRAGRGPKSGETNAPASTQASAQANAAPPVLATGATGATDAVGTALRPMDREILAALAKAAPGAKLKDALRGKPYKVDLYRDDGSATVNRLKIDLDRDGTWDEKWDVEGVPPAAKVKRMTAKGPEAWEDAFRLDGERWAPKGGAGAR